MEMKGVFGGTVMCNKKFVPVSSFGPYEIAGGWRELHSEELNNLYIQYYSVYQIKEEDLRSA
jgi:hypothetical protein